MPQPATASPPPEHSRPATRFLVGRERERALLHEHLAGLRAGQAGLLLLGGEAGIGKSAQLRYLGEAARAQGVLVAAGHSEEAGNLPVFAPWLEAVADLPGAETLPPPFGVGAAAGSLYHLRLSVAGYLRRLAGEQPIVLLLDDLHWADHDSLAFLAAVARRLTGASVLIAGAYRSAALTRDSPLLAVLPDLRRIEQTSFMTVGNLTEADAAELVEGGFGPCSPQLARYLHVRAGGNPLFLVEILRDLAERQLLRPDTSGQLQPPGHDGGAPALLVQIIAQRAARLGDDAETLLELAAVAGGAWRLELIEGMLGWEELRLLRALDAAEAADLIQHADDGEVYRFSHALIGQALAGQPSPRRRRALHARIAAALAASPAAGSDRDDALAWHYAGAGEWELAARHELAAGDNARQRLAGHSALAAYGRAMAACGRMSPEVAEWLQLEIRERMGQTRLLLGDASGAEEEFRQLQTTAQAAADPRASARALIWLSYAQRRQYHPHASLTSGAEALQAADTLGDPGLQALAHWNLGHLHEVYGPLPEADVHARAAVDLARSAGASEVLSRSLQIRSILGVWHGAYAEATELAWESLRSTHQGHDGLTFAAAHWRLGLGLGEAGRYSEARRLLLLGMENAEAIGEFYYQVKLLNTLGWLHLEVGDATGARVWDLRALETVRRSDFERVTEAERYTLLNLASDELAAGDLAAAAGYLREFGPLRDQRDYGRFRYLNRAQLEQAELSLAQGDPVSARNTAEAAGRHAAEHQMPKNLVRAQLLSGRTWLAQGQPQVGLADLEAGVALADELGHGRLRWQGRLWLGETLAALRQEVEPVYAAAWEQLQALAREVVEDDLRHTLLTSREAMQLRDRIDGPALPAAVARPVGLTVRELDVFRLLLLHHTDREIAEALFLSHRTVGTHVANILSKLGVANRREAIGAARTLGWT